MSNDTVWMSDLGTPPGGTVSPANDSDASATCTTTPGMSPVNHLVDDHAIVLRTDGS